MGLDDDALDYHRREPAGKVAIETTKPTSTQRDLSLAYSPGVAAPCRAIADDPTDAYTYTAKGNLVGMVSNGSAVLGLGDIGAGASKPVIEGKGVLLKRFADIDVFDLELDTDDPDAIVDAVSLTELSEALDLAKSTVHNHLATLVHEGLLVEERGQYHIGLRFLEFGEHARNRREHYTPAKIQVYRLAESTNEEANFAVAENGYMFSIEYVMGDANPNNPAVGSTFLKAGSKFGMHNSAPGKAVLSELSTERIEGILDRRGLPATTENTITEQEALFEELETVREQGYATNDEELEVGFRSIAAPVTLGDGTVLGSLSIGGPAYRFELDEASIARSVDILQNTVDDVEREIGQMTPTDDA